MTVARKKLIEVALPLEAINKASVREKSIRHGHPSTLHLWWARRPLATARAVIFASLVDDPDDPNAPAPFVQACRQLPKGKNAASNDTPRMRLFDFIERLVLWESTNDKEALQQAQQLIQLATEGNQEPVLDPFAGGGSIPLEAQRLGLQVYASDLNPVAVLINKAQIEIPPRFAEQPPINKAERAKAGSGAEWPGATGLAADVRYYGEWMREQAWQKIGNLYPQHNDETVIAWLWARTVQSPNPAVNAHVPLVRSFILSKKKGREQWAQPIVEGDQVRFEVIAGLPPEGDDGTVGRQFNGGKCIISGTPMPWDYIREEGKAGRMGAMLMAMVTEGKKGRSYYTPADEHALCAKQAEKLDFYKPRGEMPLKHRNFQPPGYGMYEFGDLFTDRQLVALTTFSDLVAEARAQIYADAVAAGLADDDIPLRDGGRGARAYAEAVSVYLAFAVDKGADYWSALCSWHNSGEKIGHTFARQALPMVWDFVEANPFSSSSGNWRGMIQWIWKALETLPDSNFIGHALQQDATQLNIKEARTLSTDPPYYDNIGYADLSDFFYVWLRQSLRAVYPDIFGTLLVPKELELIASPYRHGGSKEAANEHFENGLKTTFEQIREFTSQEYPLTVYYAYKQQEATGDQGLASTGWETMLSALMQAGFAIVGTWPMRTELSNRMVGMGTNALASSIVLVCRPRPAEAASASRRNFVDALRRELPAALQALQSGNIAPVDLAQASIGPGMAVYSRYRQVLENDGSTLTVRTALALINQILDEYLAESEGDLDADSRFAISWFEQYGFQSGSFGAADTLARAKNTAVDGLAQAGVLKTGVGKVQLIPWQKLDAGWEPSTDKRDTVWEATHHLIERLHKEGEIGSAQLLAKMPNELAAAARQLAYRLYTICERKGWAEHGRDYNSLVISWSTAAEQAVKLKESYVQKPLGLNEVQFSF